jgi:glycosyltransferase involved in cell wall biosynthesis
MKLSPAQLTVIVPTGNRADVIEGCLQSVTWADELLVVDSFSSDGTLAIAEQYADRVLRREYVNSANQKNWVIPQATHEWILIVDTDERVTLELRREIESILAQSNIAGPVGYRIPRVNYLWGKPVYHGGYYPDYQVRFFKRDHGRYETRQVHAHVLLDGECGTLQSPLTHYAHRSLDQTLSNLLVRMTTWEAEHRIERARQAGRKPTRRLWLNLIFRPIAAFFLRYVRQQGFRDGYRGLILSLMWAMYVGITYMKVWEMELNLPDE